MTEYALVSTLFAEACAHIRKPEARQIITAQLCDFREEHYPEFDEREWRRAAA